MSPFDMHDQVAVITGGGRGLGEGMAHCFARAGAAVVLAARRQAEIDQVAADVRAAGGRAIAVATDVTDAAAVERLAEAAEKEFGAITTWMNNAGGSPVITPLTQLDPKEWQACVDLNFTSVFTCSVVAARHMESGCIINTSSLASYRGAPGSGHYGACKAAVNSLTMTLSLELAPKIRVNGISPGYVPTEIMMKALKLTDEDLPKLPSQLGIPLGRLGTPEDIGNLCVYLASPAGSWVTGQTIVIAGGH
ncbi:MAG: glucose 1-dehydrogenase [Gammaproteobacteria bacterium]|nr:glucose 1-dehydrogenase [Gammaproteobacteria bacterium]